MREHTRNTALIVETIKAWSKTTDEEIAGLLGISGSGVNKALRKAREGAGDLSIEHVARFAEGFGVPLYVMFLPYVEALRWLAENNPTPQLVVDIRTDEQDIRRSGWHERTIAKGLFASGLGAYLPFRSGDISTVLDAA